MNSSWIYNEKPLSEDLIIEYGETFSRILASRNINNKKHAQEFLEPEKYLKEISPFAFLDMQKTIKRIEKAILNQEKIIIWGDFDADGVTSTSILFNTLKHLDADVEFYLPDRITEGHGLNTKALIKLKTANKMKLLITVDCGISNQTQVKLLNGFGVDTIITDHHETTQELPPALAIINAHAENTLIETLKPKEIESLNYLAGVGVAYKLCRGLLEHFEKTDYIDTLLPLVAVGTIADVVPLLGENRLLIKKGINQIKKACPKCIEALLNIAGFDKNNCTSKDIAFGIAPRINAIGRLEHTKPVVELFTTDDDAVIQMHANYMNSCNRVRQGLCDNIFEEAVSKISTENLKKNKAIILVDNSWHIGVIGIIASKLCEKFYRPVFILRLDDDSQKIRCSARGISGLNLYDVLFEQKDNFEVFGGHAFAAGFSADIKNLDKIIENLNISVNENLDDENMYPRIDLEADLQETDLTIDFVKNLNKLEPFGEKNPSPIFSLKNAILRDFKTIGANSNHLKLIIEKNNKQFESVLWGKSSIDAIKDKKIDLAFSPQINTFMDKTSIQLEICDYKAEISAKPSAPKIIDHRKKTNALDLFLNYLKNTKTKIAVFAENQASLDFLASQDLQDASIINRITEEKVDQVAFFDVPSSAQIFEEVLNNTSAKVVHILGNGLPQPSCKDIIKKSSGMLKYAYSNLDGIVEINKMATKLAITKEQMISCYELLENCNVIEIIEKDDRYFKIKFLSAQDFSKIKGMDAFLTLGENISQNGLKTFETVVV